MTASTMPVGMHELSRPVAASRSSGQSSGRGGTALSMLTIYIVLLFAVPSNLTISALGSFGRPSFLWGLCLLVWWALTRLQVRTIDVVSVWQPVRLACGAVMVVALLSFAAAAMRGQPLDQLSPAITALARLLSWAGVLLVAMDGIRTHTDLLALTRRMVAAGALLAAFGVCQFLAGESLLGWMAALPGVSVDLGGVNVRGSFTRASGTATHPLEYTATIACLLPLAIAHATRRRTTAAATVAGWVPAGTIAVAALLSVSRSAIIGLVVAVAASLPGLPRTYRWVVGFGGLLAAIATVFLVPGVMGTTLALFTQATDDPSTQSRTNALARVPEFLGTSPFIGQGFGTFLPRYYIFDNAWVLITVELGIVGVLAFLAMVGTGVFSALRGAKVSAYEETTSLGYATAASLVTISVLFLFFDGLSFPIAAGTFALVIGVSGAIRAIGAADASNTAALSELFDVRVLAASGFETSFSPIAATSER
ncbi:O-antigen ligase family protein (plasmid) [Coraliomargarita sp. W4R53]